MGKFYDRFDAGRKLAELLASYRKKVGVVYALPRGGVPVAAEVAKSLNAPLDLLFSHKIGHPYNPEYAIAAIAESGQLIGNSDEVAAFGEEWLKKASFQELEAMKQKRQKYLKGKEPIDPKGKIAVVVDDGIATGLTLEASLIDLKSRGPSKIIVAVPVAPKSTLDRLLKYADEVICPLQTNEGEYLGSVGAYYQHFDQTSDEEVIKLLATS